MSVKEINLLEREINGLYPDKTLMCVYFFIVCRKCADIAPLLDVEDMVRMQKPDWKCVFTYVQSLYRKLHTHERNKTMAAGGD